MPVMFKTKDGDTLEIVEVNGGSVLLQLTESSTGAVVIGVFGPRQRKKIARAIEQPAPE